MNKAEKQALKSYPEMFQTLIPVNGDDPEIKQDCNMFKRIAYIEGYHQAEKDLALTWEDIENIYRIQYEVECDYGSNAYRMNNDRDHSEKVFKEVFRRFKEIKK